MAFASFGAKLSFPPGRGAYCFRIHGQIHHRTGSLHPAIGTAPLFSQLYIIEGNEAVQYRLQHPENKECLEDTMLLLTTTLSQINPYALAYKYMHQVETDLGHTSETVSMYFKRGHDQRRYNEPTHDEVAIVFKSIDGEPPADRDIVVHPYNEPPRNISYMSANTDPMTYPILFPRGDLGWYSELAHDRNRATAKRNTVTLLQFYSYRLAARATFSPIFWEGKLFQQYVRRRRVRQNRGFQTGLPQTKSKGLKSRSVSGTNGSC